ncbi:MAG: LacI family DNA-binding transcriptional regulator [Caldilineaceae bacterium]|nr:LacI family DNA-binding transcriptional regulator [Caldilineaceae bacterium]
MAVHPSHRVTIIDVARHANVSAGTVSNALTGKRPVAEETRARIMQAIRDLGYQPNLLARGLVNQRSQTVGVVASGLDYYGPSRTLIGIDQEANALGYALLLDLLHSPMEANVDTVLNVLSARRVDGIIWAVHEIGNNRAWVASERLNRLPPIVFLTMHPQPGVAVVNTDNYLGAKMATQHLLELGRCSIGLISGPLVWWEARERQRGWRDCLLAAGREASDNLTVLGDWRAASGEAGLMALIEARPEIDAVFVANDEMALGVLRAAHRLGKRVPEDLAVVGYDNMPDVPYFWPALTSVRPRLLEVGKLAIQTLHSIVEARRQNQEISTPEVQTLGPELIVRESTVGDPPTGK